MKENILNEDEMLLNSYNVHRTFNNLIGPISTAILLDHYKESHKEYKEILSVILKWAADYEIYQDLSRIDHIELLDIYNKLFDFNADYIVTEDGSLAEEIDIWMGILMSLRKKQIEQKEEK